MASILARGATGTALAVSVALLAACTSGSSRPTTTSGTQGAPSSSASSTPSLVNSGPHNTTDVAFARTLAQLSTDSHDMADLVAHRADHPALNLLAATVTRRAHDDDSTLHAWLTSWHQPTSSPTSYPGRVDAAHFRAMSAMHGNAFDDDWLEHMAGNYTAAITACQQELDHGTNPQARQLGASRLAAMRTELGQIRSWHSNWEHDSRLGPATPGDPATSRPHASDTPHPGYSTDPGT